MKNIINKVVLAGVLAVTMVACKKSFLEVTPVGVLDEATLATEKGVNNIQPSDNTRTYLSLIVSTPLAHV